MARDIRPGTLVNVSVPQNAVPPKLCDLKTGTWFEINGDSNVYVKTDETLGRGYRCFRVADGHLEHVNSDTVIHKIYHSVTVSVK